MTGDIDYEFIYKPQGPKLEEYILSTVRRTIIRGPLGSGKTNASCWKGYRICIGQEPDSDGVRRTRGIAVRNTYGELLSTTIKDWLDMFGDLGRYTGGGREPPTHYLWFDMEDGTTVEAEVLFIALDRPEHVKKIRGLQATWAWLNETKELTKAVVDMLDLRVGRYPKDVRPTWYGIFGDTNAPDDDHWLYKLAEEEKPEGWAFITQPGGVIKKGDHWEPNPEAENIQNLPPGYYINGMQGKKQDWIKVNLANEYGFFVDGKPVYTGYSDMLNCRPIEYLKGLPLRVGIDFGLTPAATFCQRKPMGGWRVLSELVATDMGAKAFAREIKAHVAEYYPDVDLDDIVFTGDPAGDIRAQTDEITPFQILRSEGIHALPAPTNDFMLRVEAVDNALGRMIDSEPGLLVHPRCKKLRKAMAGGYCYRRIKVAGDRFADKPDKNMHSHVAESLQYALLGGGEHREVLGRKKPTGKRPTRAVTD